MIAYSFFAESDGSFIWSGRFISSSSSRAFIVAFWIIRFVIAMYSGDSNFFSLYVFSNSLIVFESPVKKMSPSMPMFPSSP